MLPSFLFFFLTKSLTEHLEKDGENNSKKSVKCSAQVNVSVREQTKKKKKAAWRNSIWPPTGSLVAESFIPRRRRCGDLRGRAPADSTLQVTLCLGGHGKQDRASVPSAHCLPPGKRDNLTWHTHGTHHLLVMWKHIQLGRMYNAAQR